MRWLCFRACEDWDNMSGARIDRSSTRENRAICATVYKLEMQIGCPVHHMNTLPPAPIDGIYALECKALAKLWLGTASRTDSPPDRSGSVPT
jgi:hypothetical protein